MKFYKNNGFCDSIDVQNHIERLRQLRTERFIVVQVPLFGVSFDVNDLSILGGFSFMVILLWFRFSLWQELRNLRLFFDRAREKQNFRAYFHYLAMHQVLTIPSTFMKTLYKSDSRLRGVFKKVLPFLSLRIFFEDLYRSDRKFWSRLVTVLFFLPSIVQFLVLIHDHTTYDIGVWTDETLAVVGLAMGSVFLIIILILTFRCISLYYLANKVWESVFQEFKASEDEMEV
jgi:hypothetical protein